MGLLDRMRQRRALKQAERAATRDQSPVAYARFVERLIEAEEIDRAAEAARHAVDTFPHSEVAEAAHRHVRRAQEEERLRTLRGALREKRSPQTIRDLASLYLETGDEEQALDLIHRGIQEEPEYQGYYILLGDYRRRRFLRDGLARDGQLAAEHYEKSINLNRDNFRVLLKAAEHYITLGMPDQAVERCQWAIALAPDNDVAYKLLDEAKALPSNGRADLRDVCREYELVHRDEVEAGRGGHGKTSLATRYQDSPDLFSHRVGPIAKVTGFKWLVGVAGASTRAVVVPEDKAPAGRETLPMVRKLFDAAEECSFKMDVSTFRRGVFEGPAGSLFLFGYDGIRLAVLCEPGAPVDKVEDAVRAVLENDLHL